MTVLSDKLYNNGEVRAVTVAELTTLAQLRELQKEMDIPDDATLEAECDHFQGYEGPRKAIEITWRVTPIKAVDSWRHGRLT